MKISKIFLLLFLVVMVINSCKVKKYRYEPDYDTGKSYIGKLQKYETSMDDSVLITGQVYLKRQNELRIVNHAEIYFINSENDTISVRGDYLSGFREKIAPGKYKIFVSCFDCVSLVVDNLELKSNYLYLIDYWMQKGNGLTKWFID